MDLFLKGHGDSRYYFLGSGGFWTWGKKNKQTWLGGLLRRSFTFSDVPQEPGSDVLADLTPLSGESAEDRIDFLGARGVEVGQNLQPSGGHLESPSDPFNKWGHNPKLRGYDHIVKGSGRLYVPPSFWLGHLFWVPLFGYMTFWGGGLLLKVPWHWDSSLTPDALFPSCQLWGCPDGPTWDVRSWVPVYLSRRKQRDEGNGGKGSISVYQTALLAGGWMVLGVPSGFFPGILLSRKPPESQGKRRSVLEKKDGCEEWARNQPLESIGVVTQRLSEGAGLGLGALCKP